MFDGFFLLQRLISQGLSFQEMNVHGFSHLLAREIGGNRIHSIPVFRFAFIPKVMNELLSSSS